VHPSGPILLVGHGGLIRVLLGLIDDTPTDQIGKLNIPNAVPIERTIADGRWGKILSALTR
jgi:broad specificity phosphatase PhoE